LPGAAQALRRARLDIPLVQLDLGAKPLQPLDVEIDRTGADRAAAGQRYFRFAHAREKRRQHPEARPHF